MTAAALAPRRGLVVAVGGFCTGDESFVAASCCVGVSVTAAPSSSSVSSSSSSSCNSATFPNVFIGMGVGTAYTSPPRLDETPIVLPPPRPFKEDPPASRGIVVAAPPLGGSTAGVSGAGVFSEGVHAIADVGKGFVRRGRFAGFGVAVLLLFLFSFSLRFFFLPFVLLLFSNFASAPASSKCLRELGPGGCLVMRGSQPHGASCASSFAIVVCWACCCSREEFDLKAALTDGKRDGKSGVLGRKAPRFKSFPGV